MPWSPQGKYIWDFWFASREGETHIFYLQAETGGLPPDPEILKDRSSIGHAVLGKFGWHEVSCEPALQASTASGAWDNLSLWTGSIFHDPESALYYMFYTGRSKDAPRLWTPSEWQHPQQIGAATSRDLLRWRRLASCLDSPLIANPGTSNGFDGVAWRDPFIAHFDENYYCFVSARLTPGAIHGNTRIESFDEGGCIACLVSPDLGSWSESGIEILVASKDFYQMEVPQVFWRTTGDTRVLYLIFCAQEKDCSRHRRKNQPESQNRTGIYYMRSAPVPADFPGLPPLTEPAMLLVEGLYAGRILDPDGDRLWLFGFPFDTGGLAEPVELSFDGIELVMAES
ncbi:MAG: hypothetical protein AB7W16_22185 [Candidatus Obscuribacterales bacterium]